MMNAFCFNGARVALLAATAGLVSFASADEPVAHPSPERALDVAVQQIALAKTGSPIPEATQDGLTVIVVEAVKVDSIGSIVAGVVEVSDDNDTGESRTHIFTFQGNDQTVAGTGASPTQTVLPSPRLRPEQGSKIVPVSVLAERPAVHGQQQRYPD